jgi:hypothetical protein
MYMLCPRQKKRISRTFKIDEHWYLYVPKSARERGRASERAGGGGAIEQGTEREREREFERE